MVFAIYTVFFKNRWGLSRILGIYRSLINSSIPKRFPAVLFSSTGSHCSWCMWNARLGDVQWEISQETGLSLTPPLCYTLDQETDFMLHFPSPPLTPVNHWDTCLLQVPLSLLHVGRVSCASGRLLAPKESACPVAPLGCLYAGHKVLPYGVKCCGNGEVRDNDTKEMSELGLTNQELLVGATGSRGGLRSPYE